ncbi:MAG: polysaccharide pyruvyl transferase family protein [Lachnospiraceae bacterium]
MNQKRLKIALAGLTFGSGNLGCRALAISFYDEITKVLDELKIKAVFIALCDSADTSQYININYPLVFIPYHLSSVKTVVDVQRQLKLCDFIVDFTEGDSFADLYGYDRFFRSVAIKIITIWENKCLILGPQTYGPFDKKISRKIATYIINKANYVFSRDKDSKEYLQQLGIKKSVIPVTDVAFLLPYTKKEMPTSNKLQVGINVSGLLWDDALSGSNSFSFQLNYIEYCKRLIRELLEGDYEVFLIPHVGDSTSVVENDYDACKQLAREYPECVFVEGLFDPVSIKGYIAAMDIFIGARMHSTIAAFSSGVFTIPFAYSKKFKGYYENLNYPVMIDARQLSTEEALVNTMNYIKNYKNYLEMQRKSMDVAKKKLDSFYNDMKIIIGKKVNA